MDSAFDILIDIILWGLAGLALATIVMFWVVLITVCVSATVKFINAYKKASKELDEDEREDPPLYF